MSEWPRHPKQPSIALDTATLPCQIVSILMVSLYQKKMRVLISTSVFNWTFHQLLYFIISFCILFNFSTERWTLFCQGRKHCNFICTYNFDTWILFWALTFVSKSFTGSCVFYESHLNSWPSLDASLSACFHLYWYFAVTTKLLLDAQELRDLPWKLHFWQLKLLLKIYDITLINNVNTAVLHTTSNTLRDGVFYKTTLFGFKMKRNYLKLWGQTHTSTSLLYVFTASYDF